MKRGHNTTPIEEIERIGVGRARTGFAAKIVILLGLFIAFVEIGFVMNFNFMLYNLLSQLGLKIEFLRYVPSTQQNMALVLASVFTLTFILYPITRRVRGESIPWYDWVLAIVSSLGPLYMFYYFPKVAVIGYPEATLVNLFFATLTIIMLIEATRRALGFVLPLVVIVFLFYALWHAGFNVRPVINHLYFEAEGVFSIPLMVMVTYVFAFLFFGSFLEGIGIGRYITDLMISLFGRRPGGPAKSAVVSSALMGTISGSSVANVLTTGTFTIPLMRKAGFPPEIAGAVEPAASTGGQLMPPIMGAAAFVMAEFLGRPYREIIIAAAIPAILYFLGIYIFIDRETKRLGLAGLPKEMLPPLDRLVRKVYMLAPIAIITFVLLVGVDPQYAVMASISSAFLASVYASETLRLKDKLLLTVLLLLLGFIPWAGGITKGSVADVIAQCLYFGSILTLIVVALVALRIHGYKWLARAIVKSIDGTARACVGVFLAAASAGVIQGVLTYTGLATSLGYKLVELAAGNLILLLIFTMMISLVLGMGVPTTANYIITSTVAAPAIVIAASGGTPLSEEALLLTAHMFVFYYGILADVTPPVALASYAGATLARSHFWRTALNASKYALAGYLVPYIFAQKPEMLIMTITSWSPTSIMNLLIGIVSAITTILVLASAITGWLNGPLHQHLRVVLLVLGLACVSTNIIVITITIITYIVTYILQYKRFKSQRLQAR